MWSKGVILCYIVFIRQFHSFNPQSKKETLMAVNLIEKSPDQLHFIAGVQLFTAQAGIFRIGGR